MAVCRCRKRMNGKGPSAGGPFSLRTAGPCRCGPQGGCGAGEMAEPGGCPIQPAWPSGDDGGEGREASAKQRLSSASCSIGRGGGSGAMASRPAGRVRGGSGPHGRAAAGGSVIRGVPAVPMVLSRPGHAPAPFAWQGRKAVMRPAPPECLPPSGEPPFRCGAHHSPTTFPLRLPWRRGQGHERRPRPAAHSLPAAP